MKEGGWERFGPPPPNGARANNEANTVKMTTAEVLNIDNLCPVFHSTCIYVFFWSKGPSQDTLRLIWPRTVQWVYG